MSHAPAAFTLDELRVRHHRLWRHVTDDHGLQVCGTVGQIEAVHRHAHRWAGTVWHDAWTPGDPGAGDHR